MEKIELKPCPHCGSKAELREHWGDCSKRPSWYEVECLNMDCGRCQDTEREAIEAWNARAQDVDAYRAAVKALVEACNEFFNPDKGLPDNLAEAFVMRRKMAEKVSQAIAAVERLK